MFTLILVNIIFAPPVTGYLPKTDRVNHAIGLPQHINNLAHMAGVKGEVRIDTDYFSVPVPYSCNLTFHFGIKLSNHNIRLHIDHNNITMSKRNYFTRLIPYFTTCKESKATLACLFRTSGRF